MGLSRRATRQALACLGVVCVGGIAGLLAGFGADPIGAPGLSPAEIVAMRFPAAPAAAAVDERDDAGPAAQSSGFVLASADEREVTSLIFNPYPVYPVLSRTTAPGATSVNTLSPDPAPAVEVSRAAQMARPDVASADTVAHPDVTHNDAVHGDIVHGDIVLGDVVHSDAARANTTRPAGPPEPLPPQLASLEPQIPSALAYATTDVADPPAPAPAKKVVAAHPQTPSNSVLNSAQIASIKERLKLTSYQTSLWPPVESALRDISWQNHADPGRKTAAAQPHGTIDPNSAPVQRLKSAAFPLLMSMSEEQKQEVRSMVRLMGLESLASQF